MFPLWSATLGLSRVNISRPSFFSWPAWRFFSQSHVQYAGPEDPIARRKWQDKRNEAQRVRYHANLEDSRKRSRLWWERQREQNPVYYEAYQKRNNLLKVRIQANDPRYGFVKRLHGWCVSHDWVREELPWETHLPVLYPEKVHKQCSGCDHLKPGGGVRLWWKLRNDKNQTDQEQYLCNACYVRKDSWQHALPKGYEDVRYMKDLIARKKELDGVDYSRWTAKDSKSK